MGKPKLRKLARLPMGPWEVRVFDESQRPRCGRGERWLRDCFVNNRYAVQLSVGATEWGEVTHLWIRRHDGETVRSWADLQRIKDELVDRRRVAVEVFPPAEQLVDQANMFHLWVLPEGFALPFGLHRRSAG